LDDVEALPGHRPSRSPALVAAAAAAAGTARHDQHHYQQQQQPWGGFQPHQQQLQQNSGVQVAIGGAAGADEGVGFDDEYGGGVEGMDEDEELPATPDAETGADMGSGGFEDDL
jgi:hypothetical protein